MAIEFDEQIWQHGGLDASQSAAPMQPDWHGLRARLLAVRETHRAYSPSFKGQGHTKPGSFSGHAARTIWAFARPLAFVNPNDSANRNAATALDQIVADDFMSGDRG
jgi:hypothetical protein